MTLDTIHESFVNGQPVQAVRQIIEYNYLNINDTFFNVYQDYLLNYCYMSESVNQAFNDYVKATTFYLLYKDKCSN